MLDVEVMLTLGSTATSLGVVIFCLNRFRRNAGRREWFEELADD